MTNTCNHSTEKWVEAGRGPGIQGQASLGNGSESQASLGYLGLCLKTNRQTNKRKEGGGESREEEETTDTVKY